jgi:Restriction endonuclease S subunits
MNRYEKYKSVSLPWVNEIPEHWEIIRNKNIFVEQKKSVGSQFEKYKLLSLSLKGVIERNLEDGGKFPASFEKYTIVNPKDLVFCLFDIDETPRTIGISKIEGMITSAYNIMAVKKDCAKYMYYFYLYLDFIKGLKPYYSSLRKTVNIDTFNSFKILIPPINEQEQIANYLDWKINEIDRLIEINKEKIKQFKKYIISSHERVILKKHSELKEWIVKDNIYDFTSPNVRIKKLKSVLVKVEHDALPDADIIICSNNGKSFVRGDKKIGLYSDDINMYQNVNNGQIMIHGMDTWHGAICISKHSGRCTRVVHVCETKEDKRYVCYYLRLLAFLKLYKPFSNGVRQNTSDFRSWDRLGQVNIILPTIEQQHKIAELLSKLINNSEKLIDEIMKENDMLENLKQSLISEVVTGKIDVRNIVIPEYKKVTVLDDETEEFDEMEDIEDGD